MPRRRIRRKNNFGITQEVHALSRSNPKGYGNRVFSGVPHWTPDVSMAGLRCWLDPSNLNNLTIINDRVQYLNDNRSLHPFSQDTAANRPYFGRDINGLNALEFRAGEYMTEANGGILSNFVAVDAYSLFVVFEADAVAGIRDDPWENPAIFSDGLEGFFGLHTRDSEHRITAYHGESVDCIEPAVPVSAYIGYVCSVVLGSGTLSIRINGGTPSTAAADPLGSTNGAVGLGYSPYAPIVHYDGLIGELLIFNVDVGATTRGLIESYLARKWGIAL